MKPDAKVRQYRSDVVGDRVRMGIAEGAEAHIVSILTEMYADTELACIREYSTNAYDSHTEAGQTRPIEVTLPTPYLPVLTIRDYGVGLDEEGIRELYSQYGASSKRSDNSAQGMLGIGCKSALAYTDQFTVVGFKSGVKTQVLISRDEDGAASQTIVSVEYGEYENGVEVTIPCKADNTVASKAHEFYKFWPEGSVVILKGNDPPYEPRKVGTEFDIDDGYTEDGENIQHIWLDDRTLLTNEVDEDLVVMGYVAYPLVDGMDPLFDKPAAASTYNPRIGRWEYKQFSAVCFVDIGEVNFAPSRESLMTTKRTKDRVAELRKHVAAKFDASIRAQIAGANTAKEAQELLTAGMSMGFDENGVPPQWQGRDVLLKLTRGKKIKTGNPPPNDYYISAGGAENWPVEDCLKYSYLFFNTNSYGRKQGERGGEINLSREMTRYGNRPGGWTIFTGFDGKWLTNVKRAKLELWASNKGVNANGPLVFVDKLTKDEKFWLDGHDIYDWAEVDATALPTQTTADGTTVRLKGSYDVVKDGKREPGTPAHKIDTTKPLYYTHGNHWHVSSHRAIRSGAVSMDGATIVALSQNRIEKFKRDFPMAVELSDAAKEAAKEWVAKINSDQVKAHAVQEHRAHYTLASLKGEVFDDPTLNTLIRLATTKADQYKLGLERYGSWVESQDTTVVREMIDRTIKRYPLAPWLSTYSKPSGTEHDHIVLYINAALAAEKE
jgi:hypothetical protein